MSDFLIVVMTMVGLAYAAWFIYRNDGEGNTRPDKTFMAMVEDKNPARRRWFGMPSPRDRRN
jgi:hypothetical protein